MKLMINPLKKGIALLTIILLLFSSACSGRINNSESLAGNNTGYRTETIRLAYQYGIHYAPVYVMLELKLLEKHLPGIQPEWSQLAGGSAMNEALIADQLDVAFMGIPPLLVAWAQGVDYRIASGISVPPLELMVKEGTIKSISDFKETDKIAIPGIGSIQHIALAMAAQKTFGDAHALDNNIVAMAHPDAYAALTNGTDISGHFAGMPYIAREMEDGYRAVLTVEEVCGQASIVSVATKAFKDRSADVYAGFLAALEESISLINAKDPRVIEIIARVEQLTEEDVLSLLEWPGTHFDMTVHGSMGLADFMFDHDFIDKSPEGAAEIMWDSMYAAES